MYLKNSRVFLIRHTKYAIVIFLNCDGIILMYFLLNRELNWLTNCFLANTVWITSLETFYIIPLL